MSGDKTGNFVFKYILKFKNAVYPVWNGEWNIHWESFVLWWESGFIALKCECYCCFSSFREFWDLGSFFHDLILNNCYQYYKAFLHDHRIHPCGKTINHSSFSPTTKICDQIQWSLNIWVLMGILYWYSLTSNKFPIDPLLFCLVLEEPYI